MHLDLSAAYQSLLNKEGSEGRRQFAAFEMSAKRPWLAPMCRKSAGL